MSVITVQSGHAQTVSTLAASYTITDLGVLPGGTVTEAGGTTYDWDSYHGIGHIHGVLHHLAKGLSAAMHPEYAARTYPGLQPGGTFKSIRDGKMHRWDDTTGGGSDNEDMFMATGGIVTKPIKTWLGEGKDSEAVVPLNRNAIEKAGLGSSGNYSPSFNTTFNVTGHGEDVITRIRSEFEGMLNESYGNFMRRQLV